MVSELASSAIDREIEPRGIKLKTIKLTFAVFPLSTQFRGVRANADCFGIRIMFPVERHVYLRTVVSMN